MLVISHLLMLLVGVGIGALLHQLLVRPSRRAQIAPGNYRAIPAADAYERYAAKVEGRESATVVPEPAERENPFFPAFRRAWRDRLGYRSD